MTSQVYRTHVVNHPTRYQLYIQKAVYIDQDWAPDDLLSTQRVLKRCEVCGSQWHRTNGHIAKSKRSSSR